MKRILLFLLLALCALGFAQSVPYTKFTLDNGMTFILHEDHSVPRVAVNTWFHVGSKDEPEHRSGFAHLFEHLMFMGTFRVPQGQFDKIMEAEGGDNNASTEQDRTNFYDVGPSNELPTLLWLEADRLEDLGKAMTQKKLDLQRQVVLNERREWENSPYGNSEIKMDELLYPVGHPYHFNTIGLPEDLNAATVADVKKFFATYYVPNNATMVIAGDFDSKTIRPLIDKLFGTLPRQNDPVHREASPSPNPGPPSPAPSSSASTSHLAQEEGGQTTRFTYVDQVDFPRVTMAWHAPAAFQPGDAEMDLAADVLANGISSRLYQKLIYQDKVATDVSASQDSEKLDSIFAIQITSKDLTQLHTAEEEAGDVVTQFLKDGPTTDELKRQVAQYEFGQLNGLQSIEQVADDLNRYDYYYGEPDSFKRDLDRYRNATPESVRDAARSVLGSDPAVIMTVVPQQPAPKVNPRSARPKDEAERAWTPPMPTTFKLDNGLQVSYWYRPELPLMTLTTLIKRGSDLDPSGKAGVADLTTEMLDQGAAGMSATDFSNALDQIGASFSADAGVEDTTVSISSTQEHFADAMKLYMDALTQPNFDAKEWERVKRLHLEAIQQALDDPTTVGRRLALMEFFSPPNPYGQPVTGTTKTIDAIGINDVQVMHKEVYQPELAAVFAAGSMPIDEFRSLVSRELGPWHAFSAPLPNDPHLPAGMQGKPVSLDAPVPKIMPPAPHPLRVYIVDKPGAVQTDVRFIMSAPRANDPRRLRLEAISAILGGTFTSRLNENLRESKGYSYGASAAYDMEPSVGYFVATAAVRTNVTGASLREFLKEFASIRTGNMTPDEALKAREAMRSSIVQSSSSLQGILGEAAGLEMEGRTYADLARDLQTISALKASDLNALAKSAIPLENGVLILVGDKAQIMAQYKGLGLPEPRVVKAE